MLRNLPRILAPLVFSKRVPALPMLRSLVLVFFELVHIFRQVPCFCGRIVLVARFDCVLEVHTFAKIVAMDPSFPDFFCGAMCPWRT